VRDRLRFRFAAATVAALLALPVAPAPAQQKAAGSAVQESAGVTLIEIPVNVIGKDGKPVSGLTAADFELEDDGKKVPITSVDVIDLSAPAAAPGSATPPVPAAARRLWLLVFDLTYTSPSSLLRAREGGRQFVSAAMKPNDFAAVGTLSVDQGWRLLVNFTQDRSQLASAIDTLGLTAEASRTADPLSFAFTPPGPSAGQSTASAGSGKRDADILENLRDLEHMQKQASDDLQRGRVAKLMGNLGGIGRVLDSARGRKNVLYFSEGFETKLLSGHMAAGDKSTAPSQNLATAAVDSSTTQGVGEAALSGEYYKIDSDTRYGSTATRTRLLDALSQFNRSDAVLNAIDISGLRSDSDASGSKAGSGTDALFAMAAATDGELIRNANQISGELGKLEQRMELVYLLVYQPKQLTKPGTFHTLKVKAKAPGAKVLARSGYYEPRPYRNLSPLERVLAAGDMVTGGARENEIPANLLAAAFASQTTAAQVPVLLEIPGGPLLAGDSGGSATATVQVYVYANDASGTLVDYATSEMSLDLAKVRSSLEASGLKYYATLFLPAGQYGLRALVRNGTTGRAGAFSTSVTVPQMPGGEVTVLPPFFEEAPGQWLMVRGNPRADAPPRPADYPFAVAGDSFIPSALPVFAAGAGVPVAVVGYNFGASASPTPLEVTAEIVSANGQSTPAAVTVTRRSDIERGGGRKVVFDFKTPSLSPGRYALRVALTDPASKKTGSASSPFTVK
jgi:VWFA-related protein